MIFRAQLQYEMQKREEEEKRRQILEEKVRKLEQDDEQKNKGLYIYSFHHPYHIYIYTGELAYGRFDGTRKIGPSYAKSVIYI